MEKQNPADIGIYIDDKLHIAFIPSLYTEIGYAQSINYFKLLEPPYTFTDMGNLFIQVLNDMRLEILSRVVKRILYQRSKSLLVGRAFFHFKGNVS